MCECVSVRVFVCECVFVCVHMQLCMCVCTDLTFEYAVLDTCLGGTVLSGRRTTYVVKAALESFYDLVRSANH